MKQFGVDAVLATGLADLSAYQRLRDAVQVPIFRSRGYRGRRGFALSTGAN